MDMQQAIEEWIDAASTVEAYVFRVTAGEPIDRGLLTAMKAEMDIARQQCEHAAMNAAGVSLKLH